MEVSGVALPVFLASLACLGALVGAAVARFLRTWLMLRHLPGPKEATLLRGSLASILHPHNHRIFTTWTDTYGPVFRVRAVWKQLVFVTDPRLVAEIFRKSKELDKDWRLLAPFSQMMSPQGHGNIVSASTHSPYWKAMRKGIAVAFRANNMKAGFPRVVEAGRQLVDTLREVSAGGKTVDMNDALLRESIDVIGRFGFDRDMGATKAMLAADELSQAGASGDAVQLTARALTEVKLRFYEPFRRFRVWRKDVREGRETFHRYQQMLMGLLEHMHAEDPSPDTLAGCLLQVPDPHTGKPLADERLLPEVGAIFMAGFDTSGHTATWVLFLVSQHPQVEARIVEELQWRGLLVEQGQPRPRLPTYEDVEALPFLKAVINETMRMYPAVGTATTRINPDQDIALDGGRLVIPRGVPIRMHIHSIHNCAANWERPHEFLPERFLQADAEFLPAAPIRPAAASAHSKADRATDITATATAASGGAPTAEGGDGAAVVGGKRCRRFIPFSDGVRSCVGYPLARLNLVSSLAQLYGNFTFELAPEMGGAKGVADAERASITLACANGMKMACRERNPA
ncbi:hypothetical protein WJX81_007168 [Elliptochloris bilobata]|uniref:Cytochrome P450 n=1 Tax=Elliptochloris bilobata TaxID=381761 RepID=A0AAW1R283_9CHLO